MIAVDEGAAAAIESSADANTGTSARRSMEPPFGGGQVAFNRLDARTSGTAYRRLNGVLPWRRVGEDRRRAVAAQMLEFVRDAAIAEVLKAVVVVEILEIVELPLAVGVRGFGAGGSGGNGGS